MSPELETLDQLQGGDMPLSVIRQVYPDQSRFARGMLGLLGAGEVQLLENAVEVPKWRWNAILNGDLVGFTVSLTNAGAARIG